MKQAALIIALLFSAAVSAQNPATKVYDETIDPMAQIDSALVKASHSEKRVICQVGGNWCPWCLRLAAFIEADSIIKKTINDNFVYIHVNYRPGAPSDAQKAAQVKALMKRLNDPTHFGYPVLVVLDARGKVLHIQETGCLEKDKSYDHDKLLQFFQTWRPKATSPSSAKDSTIK